MSAFETLLEICKKSCKENNGELFTDFTRAEGDYLHQESVRTANGFGRCLPTFMMTEGAMLSVSVGDKTAEVIFSKSHQPSTITIKWDGESIEVGEGPSAESFREAASNSNSNQRQARAKKTKVADVFDVLPKLVA